MTVNDFKENLVKILSECDKVKGIGQTGDINSKLIPGFSDIDLFVLCSNVPGDKERSRMYAKVMPETAGLVMYVCNGGIWGCGDIIRFNGIEVMPMYFTVEEMDGYLSEVLEGKHVGNEGRFYPTGRLASVDNINILYEEKSVWTDMKEKVRQYPRELFSRLYKFHIERVIDDEDLGRVTLRKEVLFYHQVLENALDHLLQALFALNSTYFPSRKRTEQFIDAFIYKPEFICDRLMNIIKNAAIPETIDESVRELRDITDELLHIGEFLK